MLHTATRLKIVAFAISVSLAGGCSALRAGPAADSEFLSDPEKMSGQSERYPFNAVWVSENYKSDKSTYRTIIIRPVNTAFLEKTSDWYHINSRSSERIVQDARSIAAVIEKSFREAFIKKTDSVVRLAEVAGPHTLILETALVELVPTDIARNAAGDVAGIYVLGGSLVSAGAGGSIAIEGRFIDADTKEVLWMFKDREIDQIAPIDFAGLTPYRHVEINIDVWADEIVELLNTPMNQQITHKLPFTLLPW